MKNTDINISVKKLEHKDVNRIIEYWNELSDDELLKFGADKSKFPQPNVWKKKLKDEIEKNVKQKQFFFLIWFLDDVPVGHSNIDKIEFGKTAYMHLHLWKSNFRQRSLGFHFLKKTIPLYFKVFDLDKLYCEPNSNNIAPNRVLEKLGFDFVRQSKKTPNWITFYQEVNEYVLNRNKIIFN